MNTDLAIWEDSRIEQIRDTFAKDLTTLEFGMFVQIGKATGLNPFLREIWAVKYDKSKPAQIFLGRDGYRKGAQRHPDYDYHQVDAVYSNDYFKIVKGEIEHTYDLKDRGQLVGAYCIVQKKGASKPSFVYAELKEYNQNFGLWKSKPATMLKKVSESQCLRMVFQDTFAGTYDESEDWNEPRPKKTYSATVQTVVELEDKSKDLRENLIKEIIEAKTKEELVLLAERAKELPETDKQMIRHVYKKQVEVLNG
jgi:phage recombination protein Bet